VLFRERGLAMFAQPGADALHERWDGTLTQDSDIAVRIGAAVPSRDSRPERHPAQFSGVVSTGIRAVAEEGLLVVLDADNHIRGYAVFAAVDDGRPALRWSVPRKRRFEGFIHQFDAA